jgi:hypothetical protein
MEGLKLFLQQKPSDIVLGEGWVAMVSKSSVYQG